MTQCVRRRSNLLSFKRATSALVLILAGVGITRSAHANPRVFPVTYTVDTLPKGELELEQYVDYVPVHLGDNFTGTQTWYGSTDFQTELEFGLTSKLELGMYVTFAPNPPSNYNPVPPPIEGTGLKERLKYRFAEAGEWPVDVGVYGELTENEREIELEAKILLDRRLGPVRLSGNLVVEREYYFVPQQDWVLNPSAGVAVEATPAIQPGVESFMIAEYSHPKITPRPFEQGPHVYVGPTLLSQFGRLWWSLGAYARVTDTNHTLQPVDSYGNFWVRSVFGYEL